MSELPMFPLGTVLFPGAELPLHIFEPRYRELTRDCLASDREFGVVLIERGSEVGGGDERTSIGTVARIADARELPDGRWVLAAVGDRRLRVIEWLGDDPYPRAQIEEFRGDISGGARLPELIASLRRTLGLAAELGDPAAAATIEIDRGDPERASYQAAAAAPIGPADHQRVLTTASLNDRIALLARLLEDQGALLMARIRGD